MATSLNAAASLAIDTKSLGQLKAQAAHTPDQALKAAAQQFESVFMNMMLKSMRDATPQDGMLDNEQTKMFTGMLDQQLSQNLAGRGIGLADMLVKQLSRGGMQTAAPAANALDPMTALRNLQSSTLTPGLMGADSDAMHSPSVPSAYNASTQQDFVGKMLPYALAASSASGVPPQLMLGQAALESGWGKRQINLPDGSTSYNLFGIKAGGGWTGKVAEVVTTEYKNGIASKQVEKFRAYGSYAEAFNDYASMLSSNPRYANVMQQTGSPAGMAQALQKSGYATDPKYAEKLVSVMKQLNIVG